MQDKIYNFEVSFLKLNKAFGKQRCNKLNNRKLSLAWTEHIESKEFQLCSWSLELQRNPNIALHNNHKNTKGSDNPN